MTNWTAASISRSALWLVCLLFGHLAAGQNQTTVTLNGTSYVLQPHPRVWLDGPSGALTKSLRDSTSNGRANLNNPAFAALAANVQQTITQNYSNDSYMLEFSQCALYWWATGDQQALSCAKFGINHIENIVGGSLACDESKSYCGIAPGTAPALDVASGFLDSIMTAYSLIHSQLNPSEIATFANKVLNDNSVTRNGIGGTALNPAASCVNQYPNAIWAPGNCGLVWYLKHHGASPPMMHGQQSHCRSDYPPDGCTYAFASGNLTYTKLIGYIAVGIALADDDPRAVSLLEESFDYYYNNSWAYMKAGWTGFTQSGPSYTPTRAHAFAAGIAIALRNSIVGGGPDLTSGVYLRRIMPYYYYLAMPGDLTLLHPWGYTAGPSFGAGYATRGGWMAAYLYPSSQEAQFLNSYTRARPDWSSSGLSYNSGNYAHYAFVFLDPNLPLHSYAEAPLQYAFTNSDYDQCKLLGLNWEGSNACSPAINFQYVVSKSDWTESATQLIVQAGFFQTDLDHIGPGDWGSIQIERNTPLLEGDGNGPGVLNGDLEDANVIELGGSDANWQTSTHQSGYAYAPVLRWAGKNPTGDPENRYAYALVDLTNTYAPEMKASRVQRQVIHFKKTGAQDYIVSYDDVSTAVGHLQKAFFHYYTYYGGRVALGVNSVTNTVANYARLISSFVPVAGSTIYLAADGGQGQNSYRVSVCSSLDGQKCDPMATHGEWIVVHKPSLNAADTPTPISTLEASSFQIVQIEDDRSPKVAAFARNGETQNNLSFQTTHKGTAQYVVAGLAPSRYAITVNDVTIVADAPVFVGDNTLYFEAASGRITIKQTPSQIQANAQ